MLTIGEVAARAGVATSAIRFFIGMLQDAGLRLDEIAGVLDAATVQEWKAIGRRRLDALDDEIARLERARAYLAGALLCRYDHPADECRTMNAEIDRRLDRSSAS